MQIGLVGLGRMGANMARRLIRAEHSLVVWDRSAEAVQALAGEGADPAPSLAALAGKLTAPSRPSGAQLPGRGHERRLLGSGTRVLPHDRRSAIGGGAP